LLYLSAKLERPAADVMAMFMDGGAKYRELLRAVLEVYGIELPDSVKITEADSAKILRATADREWSRQLRPRGGVA
jgi:hypothetical protein